MVVTQFTDILRGMIVYKKSSKRSELTEWRFDRVLELQAVKTLENQI